MDKNKRKVLVLGAGSVVKNIVIDAPIRIIDDDVLIVNSIILKSGTEPAITISKEVKNYKIIGNEFYSKRMYKIYHSKGIVRMFYKLKSKLIKEKTGFNGAPIKQE